MRNNCALGIIENNPLLKGVRGSIGNTIYIRRIGNKSAMCNMPESRKGNSEKQEAQINRFRWAQKYAKQVLTGPGMKELYSRGIDDRRPSAYHAAASDYLNAPVIHHVKLKEYNGAVGDVLRIKATDDFQVTEVHVKISAADGKLIEEGQAEKYSRKPFMWVYKTTVAHPDPEGMVIVITAKDRPGNRAIQRLTLDKDRQAKLENEVKLV